MFATVLPLFAQQGFGKQAPPPPVPAGEIAAVMLCFMVPFGLMAMFLLVSLWKVFSKAGQPGWAALVPFYNLYVLNCEVAKKDVLWFFLEFIPLVNIYASFTVCLAVAQKFGKSEAFGIGLFFLPYVFYPILAFGDAQYERRRKKRRDDYDDYDDEDEDDDDRYRSRCDDDDDDRYRNRYDDDDDDGDDRPRRRRR